MRGLSNNPWLMAMCTTQGKKYDKRYFELTAETLAYAKDPKGGEHIPLPLW